VQDRIAAVGAWTSNSGFLGFADPPHRSPADRYAAGDTPARRAKKREK
jgi:hypothetical protein